MRRGLARASRRPGARFKSDAEIAAMRRSGAIVAQALAEVRAAVRAGVTTAELDEVVEDAIRSRGGHASFRGVPSIVPGGPAFPAASCVSVNEEVVHGLPGQRVLRDGDIVSIDVGVILDGWHGDAAITVVVGQASEDVQRLVQGTCEALWAGIAQARDGGWLGDISSAIEQVALGRNLGVVRAFTGHAIGREMHEGFQIPNFGTAGTGIRLRAGMTLAIEPMLTLGSPEVMVGDDAWTVTTEDGSWAAHWEHTIAITRGEPVVLTADEEGTSR